MNYENKKTVTKLTFGTGGMRGIMGTGDDKINDKTVTWLTKAVALWILDKNGKSIAISYDSRLNSAHFANLSAKILTNYGIDVYIYENLMPTPALSFAVQNNSCDAGIMVTASHNRSEYNGYKVYNKFGAQIREDDAAQIENLMGKLSEQSSDYKGYDLIGSLQENKNEGLIHLLGDEALSAFVDVVLANKTLEDADGLSDVNIVYTPLNGAGLVPVEKVLNNSKIGHIYYVEEQKMPDGNFPTCEYPNPEKPEALRLGIQKMKELSKEGKQLDALIATDPDSDRLATAVFATDGDVRIISGNELGILFVDYLIKTKVKSGKIKNPIVFTTIVSTKMTKAICKKNNVEIFETLTGFKYMGGEMAKLEQTGNLDRFLFAFEESIGYLCASHSKDKDAVGSALLFCEMIAHYKKEGKTVIDRLEELYAEYGYYGEKTFDFVFEGKDGKSKMEGIMQRLRNGYTDETVIKVVDYLNDETGLPKSNVLEFQFADATLLVRPSGTEPKIKFYILAKGRDAESRQNIIDNFEIKISQILKKYS
ncbi:MAG: phospho-sugar mutase [Eubacteriales bacterium]